MNLLIPCYSFHLSSSMYEECLEKIARNKELRLIRVLHANLVITGLIYSVNLASKLISPYTLCGRFDCAHKLFDKIPDRSMHHWIVFIRALTFTGFHNEALGSFSSMRREGYPPDKFLLPSILKSCRHANCKGNGAAIHAIAVKCRFQYDSFVCSSLISMYAELGLVEEAFKFFDSIPEIDLVCTNAMVSGYAQHGFCKEAYDLVKKMKSVGLNPNIVTWNILIASFSLEDDQPMVAELFNLILASGYSPDVVSWTSFISGLVQNFHYTKAFDIFKQMLREGVYPSSDTISALIPACASVADLRKGKEIHGYASVVGFVEGIYVRTALIDMYAKCGSLLAARELFFKMPKKNTVTWNTMIFGYANHSYCREAIQLFHQMEEGAEELDHQTFTAALMACSHAGMVEHGKSLFNLMQSEYGINPRMEHYACMVDLIGRAGNLDEAYELIKLMPMEPDAFVWGALLGACRSYGHLELAELASKHVIELEPSRPGGSMLLKDLYACLGRWEKFNKMKKIMKRRKLRNFTGCSWIGCN